MYAILGLLLTPHSALAAGVAVPSIESVVEGEGFEPVPALSEAYRPGAVLVPSKEGGHSTVVADCFGVEPILSALSDTDVAASLSGGVRTRVGLGRLKASAQIERRVTFVDPVLRTIPIGQLVPTGQCLDELRVAAGIVDLSQAIVVQDSLNAIVKSTVCTRIDASGSAIALADAEAAAYSECVIESDTLVTIGFRSVPLDRVASPGTPPADQPVVLADFDHVGADLDQDDTPANRACTVEAQDGAETFRLQRLNHGHQQAQRAATAAWKRLEPTILACMSLPIDERAECEAPLEAWVQQAMSMTIEVPAFVARVPTACGPRTVPVEASWEEFDADQLPLAESLLVAHTFDPRPIHRTSLDAIQPPPDLLDGYLEPFLFGVQKHHSPTEVQERLGDTEVLKRLRYTRTESGGVVVYTNARRQPHLIVLHPDDLTPDQLAQLGPELTSLVLSSPEVWAYVLGVRFEDRPGGVRILDCPEPWGDIDYVDVRIEDNKVKWIRFAL